MSAPDTPDDGEDFNSERYRIRDRRARILELLQNRDFIEVNDLASMFDVTVQSIRRDLTIMAEAGLVLRKRGGATRPPTGGPSRRFLDDTQINATTKARIGQAAAALIKPGSVAFFYSGSTVARTAMCIPEDLRTSLTVVSNSLPIMDEVSSWSDPHFVAVGGLFLQPYMAYVGPQAISTFRELNADVAIIGASGLSATSGLTTPHHLIAEVGSVIVERAHTTIVVADHTKIGRGGLTPIAPLKSIDILITDEQADSDELDALRGLGIDVRSV
jgi:DeoR/GlpR family transcriptional regulator of sugar metabolism